VLTGISLCNACSCYDIEERRHPSFPPPPHRQTVLVTVVNGETQELDIGLLEEEKVH
jgi:hypothetical protein